MLRSCRVFSSNSRGFGIRVQGLGFRITVEGLSELKDQGSGFVEKDLEIGAGLLHRVTGGSYISNTSLITGLFLENSSGNAESSLIRIGLVLLCGD